jgi:hypothetical protein
MEVVAAAIAGNDCLFGMLPKLDERRTLCFACGYRLAFQDFQYPFGIDQIRFSNRCLFAADSNQDQVHLSVLHRPFEPAAESRISVVNNECQPSGKPTFRFWLVTSGVDLKQTSVNACIKCREVDGNIEYNGDKTNLKEFQRIIRNESYRSI